MYNRCGHRARTQIAGSFPPSGPERQNSVFPEERIQMKKVERSVACALFLMAALSVPALSFAQSPFDGTWRINMNQSKISPKPLGFYLSQRSEERRVGKEGRSLRS